MSDLILEAGKRYITRSGWITPPLEFDDEFMEDYPFYAGESNECSIGIQSWTRNGMCHRLGKLVDGADLVREYAPEPSVPGVPEGWRVVRYGPLQAGEFWLPPDGAPLMNTIDSGSGIVPVFHAVIVERIASA